MENNIYYLYIYLDPRKPGIHQYHDLEFLYEPFYVGISKSKKRHLEHLDEAYRVNCKTYKCNKIRKIKIDTGNDPIFIKRFENLSKIDAAKLEKEYILKIGRSDLGKGPLTNLTNGGDGVTGYIHSYEQTLQHSNRLIESWKNEEYRKKMSKISSESQKRLWKNENYRSRVITGIKQFYKNNPDLKIEQTKKLKKTYKENPILKEIASKKLIEQRKDIKFLNNLYKNVSEKNSKSYIVTYPDGHKEIIKNLAKFCRENDLDPSAMFLVWKGKYKHHHNFKCRKIEENKE